MWESGAMARFGALVMLPLLTAFILQFAFCYLFIGDIGESLWAVYERTYYKLLSVAGAVTLPPKTSPS